MLMSDKVFGFCFEEAKCKTQQEFVTVLETSLGKVNGQRMLKDISWADMCPDSTRLQSPRSCNSAKQCRDDFPCDDN
jgi:hypothetical protein